MVTKQMIIDKFNCSEVKQIDSKQLFIITKDNEQFLVSYFTIVGKVIGGRWHVTTEKYSVTTTRQLSYFARTHSVIWTDTI